MQGCQAERIAAQRASRFVRPRRRRIDNSNNYVEGIGKIYLRKTFDWFAPMAKSDAQSIAARDQPFSRL